MKFKYVLIYVSFLFINFSCQEYLSKIPDKSLTIPNTIEDLSAILNNNLLVQDNAAMPEFGTDDYYFEFKAFQSQSIQVRNCYTWQTDIFLGSPSFDWNFSYRLIYNANVVLAGLKSVTLTNRNKSDYNQLWGRALFLRAFGYYNLSQEFIKPYDLKTAEADLGLPLRLSPDPNEKVKRSTVQETYQRLIDDLSKAIGLLQAKVTIETPNIPSKPAAMALLSRVYLNMGNYINALKWADSALYFHPNLMNYNDIDTTEILDFPYPSNREVLYQAYQSYYFPIMDPITIVDSMLYGLYEQNDLRKSVFYKVDPESGHPYFRGSYTGRYSLFAGLATDELYLISAECLARLNKMDRALSRLNTLLKTRYKSGTFIPITSSNPGNVLAIIIRERRKELAFRGIRWSDLRRLNKDSRFAISLKRVLNGKIYTLPPNDPRYTFPFPENEIELTGVQQNRR